ncbi:MAG TPA: DUF6036 family nucleotidyltransferase [Lichenihabitans sp.]|jgi:hypothetical protein|nr:DUF6036 family nucleotidyltransferase [Lichenihabitans sp.]
MSGRATRLRKQDIAHLLRSAAAITRCSAFVMVGTGAVIARGKTIPLDLMRTREIDIYALGIDDVDEVSTLIDGTIGEGSQFDEAFGYYAHGVGERTACLPEDWRTRATELRLQAPARVTCLCPETNDIALAKACAWREKDRAWLRSALLSGIISLDVMSDRAALIDNPNAPPEAELRRRLATLRSSALPAGA